MTETHDTVEPKIGGFRWRMLLHPGLWGRLAAELGDWFAHKFWLWLAHCRWTYLLAGLPALAVLAGAFGFVARQALASQESTTAYYGMQGAKAFANEDYKLALLCCQRVVEVKGQQPDLVYTLALIHENLGDKQRAQALFAELAPNDKLGYGPAHLGFAKLLLSSPKPVRATVEIAETHLRRALHANPKDQECLSLLGTVCANLGKLPEARELLTKVVAKKPQLQLLLAKVYRAEGDLEQARRVAAAAHTDFTRQLAENPDDGDAILGYADSCMFLDDYEGAVKTLQAGWKQTNQGVLREAQARVYVLWADNLAAHGKQESLRRRLQLLRAALAANPNEPLLFSRLTELLREAGDSRGELVKELDSLLAAGESAGLVHLVLGTHASEMNDLSAAQFHLEQAYKLDPAMPAAANNLAWTLAHLDPPQLEQAQRIIDDVVQHHSQWAAFHDTRGRIYFKRGLYREAIAELELVLPSLPKDAERHEYLATSYRELGLLELAQQHALRAEQLKVLSKPNQPPGN